MTTTNTDKPKLKDYHGRRSIAHMKATIERRGALIARLRGRLRAAINRIEQIELIMRDNTTAHLARAMLVRLITEQRELEKKRDDDE